MCLKWVLILIVMNNLCACKGVKYDANNSNSWITRMRAMRRDIKDCVKNFDDTTTWGCLKVSSLRLFDEMTSSEVIPLWRGIRLVRLSDYDDVRPTDSRQNEIPFESDANIGAQRDLISSGYLEQITKRVTRVLQTHALQVSFKDITAAILDDKDETHGTPRHRRQRHNMMVTMVFGVTALGAVLVPMGFQFLSVISGKALLLAKMALLLASINGLKRIATSGVHYGLYQVPGEGHLGYYDRGDATHPRNIHNQIGRLYKVLNKK